MKEPRFTRELCEIPWKERNLFQKVFFWKRYFKEAFLLVDPADDAAYESAPYEMVTIIGKEPWRFEYREEKEE